MSSTRAKRPRSASAIPALRTPGLNHRKIIMDDSAVRKAEIARFNKRLRWTLAIAILLCMGLATVVYSQIWERENTALESRLETFTELRDEALRSFLTSLDNEVQLWSRHPDIVKDADVFVRDWHEFTPTEIEEIRAEYIQGVTPPSLSPAHQEYNQFHALVHDNLDAFLRHHGYYDVFIFDLDGNLVYTVEKEDDFGYNFLDQNQPYFDTGLGEVYRAARQASDPDAVFYADFKPYAPSADAPAAFLASQIIDTSGTLKGIYAIQIPIDKFDEVLQFAEGLGETGESYLVGQNFLMHNQSRLTDEPTTLKRRVENEAVRAALNGKTTLGKGKNALGRQTIVAAMPLVFKDVKYAVATEMELSEKREPIRPYTLFFVCSVVFFMLFGFASYTLLRARMNRNLSEFADADSS